MSDTVERPARRVLVDGLREREHLQLRVLADPEIIEDLLEPEHKVLGVSPSRGNERVEQKHDAAVTCQDMNYPLEQARADLSFFAPARKDNYPQGLFRSIFFDTREHVLGKRASMHLWFDETVAFATRIVRESHPGFTPLSV